MARSRRQLELISRPWAFRLLEGASHLARFPRLKRAIPWFRDENFTVSCLPVNDNLELPESAVTPVELLLDFIERASHRVVLDFCACREAMSCENYPRETGCLMMGDAALEIDRSVRREVSVDEAVAHTGRAVESGLIPITGKVRLDNLVFGVRNKGQLLSTCFCCECCCISRFAKNLPPDVRAPNIRPLSGLKVTVSDDCHGCGACVSRCFLSVIDVRDGRAVIGDGCAGCGRCATVCPRNAVTVSIDDPLFIDEARARIESVVDFT